MGRTTTQLSRKPTMEVRILIGCKTSFHAYRMEHPATIVGNSWTLQTGLAMIFVASKTK
jgi:hypothetical protein